MRVCRRGAGFQSLPLFILALTSCPGQSVSREESRLRAQLQATSQLHDRLPSGQSLDLDELRFSEVVVALRGDRAEVLAHVEGSGSFGGASLHYIGSERLLLHREGNGYAGPLLPALFGVLAAVAERQRALLAGDETTLIALAASDYHDGSVDRDRLAPLFATLWPTVDRAEPSSLAVRVDHDRAVVSLSHSGDGGSHTHTLTLEKDVKTWRYSAGLL
jgi:hypothetical protein